MSDSEPTPYEYPDTGNAARIRHLIPNEAMYKGYWQVQGDFPHSASNFSVYSKLTTSQRRQKVQAENRRDEEVEKVRLQSILVAEVTVLSPLPFEMVVVDEVAYLLQ